MRGSASGFQRGEDRALLLRLPGKRCPVPFSRREEVTGHPDPRLVPVKRYLQASLAAGRAGTRVLPIDVSRLGLSVTPRMV